MTPSQGLPTLRSVLGLPADADDDQVEPAYARLHRRVEARLQAASDDGARTARRRELELLEHLLASDSIASRHDASRPSAPRDGSGPLRAQAWIAGGIAVAAAFTLGFWVAGVLREPPPLAPAPVAGPASEAEPGDAREPEARLVVETVPPGGEFILEQASESAGVVLREPADGREQTVAPGAYRLRVLRADCPGEWREAIELAPGEVRRLAPRICEGEGRLIVRSNVSGDRLQVDGRDLGSTGALSHSLDVGDHTLRVEKPGYEPWTGEIRLRPDEALTVRAELVPLAQRAAPSPSVAAAPPPRAVAPPPRDFVPEELPPPSRDELVATGGSRAWHDEKSRVLIARYDLDGSGRLDTLAEADAIPCAEWQALERSYDQGPMTIPMPRLYGFDGSAWRSGALGFDRRIRSHVYERMKSCGLRG